MDLGAILQTLYNAIINLAKGFQEFWKWFNRTIVVYDGFSIPWFRGNSDSNSLWPFETYVQVIIPRVAFAPIMIFSMGGLIMLLGLALVKKYVPLA